MRGRAGTSRQGRHELRPRPQRLEPVRDVRCGPGPRRLQFTLELWFKRTGAVSARTPATGGLASAIPLVTKGTGGGRRRRTVDMNYFLGIDARAALLVARLRGHRDGLEPPGRGRTAVVDHNVWHHAAATYDGTTWRLYLDGTPATYAHVGAFTPRGYDSIQHAALGTAHELHGRLRRGGSSRHARRGAASGTSPARRRRSRPPRTRKSPSRRRASSDTGASTRVPARSPTTPSGQPPSRAPARSRRRRGARVRRPNPNTTPAAAPPNLALSADAGPTERFALLVGERRVRSRGIQRLPLDEPAVTHDRSGR